MQIRKIQRIQIVMPLLIRLNLKYLFTILLAALFLSLQGQSLASVDDITNKIFNQDFEGVPAEIDLLRKTSPQQAKYVKVDYLWWKMITDNTKAAEASFLSELDSVVIEKERTGKTDYDRLLYFTYQIRYDNLRKKSFSKYLNLIKLHLFLEKMNPEEVKNSDPFVVSLFNLMIEMDLFMKYKFLSNNGFQPEINRSKCQTSLTLIENLHEPSNKTFGICKTYLLGKIYLDIENDYTKANMKFVELSEMFPGNLIFKKSVEYCKAHL